MKLYRVSGNSDRQFDAKSDFRSVIWAGSQSDAAKARKELIENGFKRTELLTEDIDVPTNKEGLLDFLNGLGA